MLIVPEESRTTLLCYGISQYQIASQVIITGLFASHVASLVLRIRICAVLMEIVHTVGDIYLIRSLSDGPIVTMSASGGFPFGDV